MYLSSKNFKPHGLDLSKVEFISEADFQRHFKEHSKAITKPSLGDVLVGIIGSLGEPYVVRATDRFGLSSSVAILRPNKNLLLPKYLYYWMRGAKFQSAVYGIKGGVAQSYLSLEMIRSLPVEFPNLDAQRRIVDILSACDDLIENNTRRIQILEQMAQLLYRVWFVNFRFPCHDKVKMVESEIGLVPKGWRVSNIGELFELHIGGGWGEEMQEAEFTSPAYVIRGTDIPPARIGNLDKCPLRYHKKSNLASRVLEPWDIVFEVSGGSKGQPVGRSLLIHPKVLSAFGGDVMCASFCKLLRPKTSRIGVAHLYQYLLEIYSNGIIDKYQVQSTGITNFKFAVFLEDAKLAVPPEDIRDKFEQLCRPILDTVFVLGRKNANLRETRDLLLPKLVSGEVSVENLEEEALAETV
jgi:type I restriction enzyme S subunit